MSGNRHVNASSIDEPHELQKQHQLALAENADWLSLWELFSEHPWFQKQLAFCATKATIRFHAPKEWVTDIQQDALIRFGAHLQRDPTLGFDATKGTYAGWIFLLLRSCCLKALKQFKESRKSVGAPSEGQAWEDSLRPTRIKLEVLEELQRLPTQRRNVLCQYINGAPVSEIATSQAMSVRSVYRLIESSLAALRVRFEENP